MLWKWHIGSHFSTISRGFSTISTLWISISNSFLGPLNILQQHSYLLIRTVFCIRKYSKPVMLHGEELLVNMGTCTNCSTLGSPMPFAKSSPHILARSYFLWRLSLKCTLPLTYGLLPAVAPWHPCTFCIWHLSHCFAISCLMVSVLNQTVRSLRWSKKVRSKMVRTLVFMMCLGHIMFVGWLSFSEPVNVKGWREH